MQQVAPDTAAYEFAFEVHGVRIGITTSEADLSDRVVALTPSDSRPCPIEAAEHRFALWAEEGAEYRIVNSNGVEQTCLDRDLAVGLLEAQLRVYIAMHAQDRIFIHAGVVAHRDCAIVIPGPPFSGKTTLVAALVRAGAVYYSDEFALLNERGLVHPYPRPLSIRSTEGVETNWLVERLGGKSGEKPLPVGLIVVTTYRPGAEWSPELHSRGQGILALLSNTLPGRDRPEQALSATRAAVEPALVLEGERGEATAVAPALLQTVEEVVLS